MDDDTQPTDIFLWANTIDGIKKNLDVEFFLFNKNYTPYTTSVSSELNSQIKPLFLYNHINFVTLGAGMGLSVRDFELSDGEENVLLRTDVSNVVNAQKIINMIKHQKSEIVEFSEQEHEFKRIKGVIAKFSHKDSSMEPFYVIKQISQANVLQGNAVWEFRDGKFGEFQPDVGIKMPSDNQVLIIGEDIFVFNQSKFERLFNYDYKKQALADQKVAEIEKLFKLSFPDGIDLQSLVRERKKSMNKLQKMDIGAVTHEQVIEYADDMQLEIMTDDAGAIIIMDGSDLDTLVSLINEDYISSHVTGKRYEIKSKRTLDSPEGEPPRG
jgi:hypothetical protein